MTEPSLIRGYDPIFRKKALPVEEFDDGLRATIAKLYEILYVAGGIGLGANMVGLLRRIAIVDLQPNGVRCPVTLINPEITWQSSETQSHTEASLCFPGISADVTRSSSIRLSYHDEAGLNRDMEANDWLAQVIQHEVDYLDGIIFPDRLSPAKKNLVMRKIKKIR